MSVPVRTNVLSDAVYDGMDRGIRFAVRVINAQGIATCQSCEGGDGHSYDRPTVDIHAGADDAEGFAALAACVAYGLPVWDVALVWPIENGVPYEKLWRLTFRKPMDDRADETPMFAWHYQAQSNGGAEAAALVRGRG